MRTLILLTGMLLSCLALSAQYQFRVIDLNPGNGNGNSMYATVYKDKLFMNARTSGYDIELFTSNGTLAGTQMLKDLNPGGNGSYPSEFVICRGLLFFLAITDADGMELWVSDGTAAGTHMVKDINPGPGGTETDRIGTGRPLLTVMGNKVYFMANDGVHGQEVWMSDGTSAGTQMLKDINPGSADAAPMYITAYNNKLIFAAIDGVSGQEPWISDGTTAGTQQLKDIFPGAAHSICSEFTVYKNRVYFGAKTGTNGFELWVSDGTDAGTKLFKDICPGQAQSGASGFFVSNDKMFFTAGCLAGYGLELWVSDGTEAGTRMVKDIFPGPDFSTPRFFTTYQGKVFFAAKGSSASGTELWCSDGTEAGTKLVKDLVPGSSPSNPRNLIVYKNKLYFIFSVGFLDEHLAVSDGTPAGTYQIAPPGANLPNPMQFTQFVIYHDTLYFNAIFDAVYGHELWALTDTSIVTSGIRQVTANTAFSMYPNPSDGQVTLQLKNMTGIAEVQVCDMTGRKVYGQTLPAGVATNVLQLGHLPKGVYILRLQQGTAWASERLVVR